MIDFHLAFIQEFVTVAVQLQYEAVDAYMKLCRFQEKEWQVIREMTLFQR